MANAPTQSGVSRAGRARTQRNTHVSANLSAWIVGTVVMADVSTGAANSRGRSSGQGPDSLIVGVIQKYEPGWEPPRDNGREWVQCLCPFHGDSRPSAAVSYRNDAFTCFACPEKGDAIGILMRKEGMTYPEAVQYAEEVLPGSVDALQGKPTGKPRRRVFGESGVSGSSSTVPTGIRRRSAPWT